MAATNPPNPPAMLQICLRDLVGKEQHISVSSDAEIQLLKVRVSKLWPIPPVFQALLLGGETLSGKTLSLEKEFCRILGCTDCKSLSTIDITVLVSAEAVAAAVATLQNGGYSEKVEALQNLGALGQRSGSDIVAAVTSLLSDGCLGNAALETLIKITRLGDMAAKEALSSLLRERATRHGTLKALKTIAEHGDEDVIFIMVSYLKDHAERAGGASEVSFPVDTMEEYIAFYNQCVDRALKKAGYDPEEPDQYKYSVNVEAWQTYPPKQVLYTKSEWERKARCQSAFPITVILSFEQENNVGICLAALEVLGHVASGTGNRFAITAIGTCLEDENREVRWKAAQQLGCVISAGDWWGAAVAKKRLNHPQRDVRWAAQEALGQFIDHSIR